MVETLKFSPQDGLPPSDTWLDRLSYRRLLSVSGSLLIAVKSPDTDLRKVLKAARQVRRNDRTGEKARAAREALLAEVKRYLQRHRSLDPTRVTGIAYPEGFGFPTWTEDGTLPAGFWNITLQEFVDTLSFNRHRQAQVRLLFQALTLLKTAGCTKVTIAGSFVSSKPKPKDIDMIWDVQGLDTSKLGQLFGDEKGTERQMRFGIDSVGSDEDWKLKLSMVQSLWGGDSPKPHECPKEEFEQLPRFRAVGVLVLDLTGNLPVLEF